MSLIVLDTDVASFSLRNRLPNHLRVTLAGHTMCITFVTVGELMKWRVLRSWDPTVLPNWPDGVGVSESWHTTKLWRIKDFADFAEHEGLILIGQEP